MYSPISAEDMPAPFRSVRTVLTAIGIGTLAAACSYTPSDRPLDVGNMAYPQALPEGNLNTISVTGRPRRDAANIAYANPVPAGAVR